MDVGRLQNHVNIILWDYFFWCSFFSTFSSHKFGNLMYIPSSQEFWLLRLSPKIFHALHKFQVLLLDDWSFQKSNFNKGNSKLYGSMPKFEILVCIYCNKSTKGQLTLSLKLITLVMPFLQFYSLKIIKKKKSIKEI